MKVKTEIEHKFPLGARVKAPHADGLDGLVVGVVKDLDGGTSYLVSAWSISHDVFLRHTISEHVLDGFEIVECPRSDGSN